MVQENSVIPKVGQVWIDIYRKQYYFITKIEEENEDYGTSICWRDVNTDYACDSSIDWFLENCVLVSG